MMLATFFKHRTGGILLEIEKPNLELCNKRWLDHSESLPLYVLALLSITALPVGLAIFIAFPDASWTELPARLMDKLDTIDWSRIFLKSLEGLLATGTLIGLVIFQRQAQKHERLTLRPDGIRYSFPLPPLLKRFIPDWSLPWDEIKSAELGTLANGRLLNADAVLLTLTSASDKRRIFASHWVDSENYSRPASRFKLPLTSVTQPHDEILMSIMTSEVVQYLSKYAPHITINSNLGKAEVFTRLEKNPHGRIALGIIVALMIYAFIDTIVGPDSYIDDPISFAHIYILSGITGAVLSGIWLYKSTLAVAEKAGLAILIGTLMAVAMLPGALRINALTDTKGAVSYDYFVTQGMDGIVLRPVVEGMPVIDYFAKNEFWNKFSKEDTYPVRLHKGGLGFYQFDSSAIVDDIRRHETK